MTSNLRAPRAILALVLLAGSQTTDGSRATESLIVETVSTRADMVTGGDVLIAIAASDPAAVRVASDPPGVEATSLQGGGDRILALVDGLPIGSTVLTIDDAATGRSAELRIENHPIQGPVFSGPHQEPFICRTEESGLGTPLDDDCSAPSRAEFRYRSGSSWATLDDPDNPPAGVPSTTTIDGETVPFIARIESGTINRAIYRIAVLDDGTYDREGRPGRGWNGKLVYTFGGGCNAGYHQGSNTVDDVLLPVFLQRGYAVATASLNVGVTNCNDVLSAETMMMVKEHFVERYGLPRYTIGQGGSGGAIQIHLIADNYPGLLDGLLPNSAFPDAFSIAPGIADCGLLNAYFARSTVPWSEPQRTAVTGFALAPSSVCESIESAFGDTIIPDEGCRIPDNLTYDPDVRPDGARCTVYDHMVNILGIDPDTGFARRPLDNVGVQYGLRALNEGSISIEQFLDLNEMIGGHDIDGRIVAQRTRATEEAVRIAYASGRVVTGRGGLGEIPVVTIAGYRDPQGNPHDYLRNFSLRDRLIRTRGGAETNALWTQPGGVPGTSVGTPVEVMDAWLETMLADTSDDDARSKAVRARPSEAVDSCWLGQRYEEPATYDEPGVCNTVYRSHADPRIAAGGPVSNDVLKCALKPVDSGAYRIPMLTIHMQRLQQIFPDGVCDFSVPGVGQVPPTSPWQSWGNTS